MRRHTSILAATVVATVLGIVCVPRGASADFFTPYNPYPPLPGSVPPTILPPGLDSEIERVQREVRTIFQRYLDEWSHLGPQTYKGNPPILVPDGYSAQRILGGLLNFDENMSPFNNEACAFCHMPYAAFSGPIPSVNLTMVAYPGTFRYRANKRTAQRFTYAPFFGVLQYNQIQGLFFGGEFWDGRATGF